MMRTFKNMMLATAAAGVIAGMATTSQASLKIDLRLADGSKSAAVSHVGDSLTLNVYAKITGTGASTDDGFQTFYGSFVSQPSGASGLVGNFSLFTASAPFNATAQGGTLQELNNQPGQDVGSNDKSVTTGYVLARAASMQTGSTEFLIGTVTWTVLQLPSSEADLTSLSFVPRTNASNLPLNVAAVWREDGLNKNPTSAGLTFGSDSPFTVVTPEPASLSLIALAAGGLLARKRRTK